MEIWLASFAVASSVWLLMYRTRFPGVHARLTRPAAKWAGSTWLITLARRGGLQEIVPGARRRKAARRQAVIEAVGSWAAELRAGQAPLVGLARAFGDTRFIPRALAASAWGGDVALALRADAQSLDDATLRGLAACWAVASDTGAGLADSLDRLAASARHEEDIRVQLQAHLAAPRATARMLAGLPVLGLLLGMGLGGDPLAWLLSTVPGLACVIGGVGLTAAGLWWTARIARNVERAL